VIAARAAPVKDGTNGNHGRREKMVTKRELDAAFDATAGKVPRILLQVILEAAEKVREQDRDVETRREQYEKGET